MVAGSVGRGTADRYSDIEIDVYYREAPTEAERVAAVEGCGGSLVALGEDEDEWAEEMSFAGFDAHTSTFLVATMERYLHEVLDDWSTAPAGQTRLFSVLNAVTLKGEEQVERWRARAATYPDGLRNAMLAENLAFEPFRYAGEMHAARGDRLVLYDVLLGAARSLLAALFGLNRIHLPTFDYLKRMNEWVELLAVSPADLSMRLERVFATEPVQAVRSFAELIDETLVLVDRHAPSFDTSPYRAGPKRRIAWEAPP